jgi:hypothetical protein
MAQPSGKRLPGLWLTNLVVKRIGDLRGSRYNAPFEWGECRPHLLGNPVAHAAIAAFVAHKITAEVT